MRSVIPEDGICAVCTDDSVDDPVTPVAELASVFTVLSVSAAVKIGRYFLIRSHHVPVKASHW